MSQEQSSDMICKKILPFDISPSVSGMLVKFSEEGDEDYIEFNSWNRENNTNERIKVKIKRLIGLKYEDLDINTDLRIGIIENSNWLKEKNEEQAKKFPEYKEIYKDIKHLFFIGHDITIQILAENIEWII